MRALFGAVVVVLGGWASQAGAHHSFAAEFIPGSSGEVEGVVTRVWFTNPHVRYRLEVTDESGATAEWELQ
ncbi:MAG: DUF6152 family protein, partial [Gammaproteobacteria bacterium]|nr:DUF6152 family protein [Gammaproteobacteria bacterium]